MATTCVCVVGNVVTVERPVPRASAPTSSCEFWEFMPGYHSPEVQAKVKIKSLLKSATRWTQSTGHVLIPMNTEVCIVFIRVCELLATPRGSPVEEVFLCSCICLQGDGNDGPHVCVAFQLVFFQDQQDLWNSEVIRAWNIILGNHYYLEVTENRLSISLSELNYTRYKHLLICYVKVQ